EALGKPGEFFRHDAPFDYLEAALAREGDHRLPGDAVEKAVGNRRVDFAVVDEEDVGAGALGDAALPVEHHGVGIALALGDVLGNGADHVEPGGLGAHRRGRGIGTAVVGEVEPDTLEPFDGIEIARPLPGGDRKVDGVVLRRDPHHLRAAPGDGAHIGVLLAVFLQYEAL